MEKIPQFEQVIKEPEECECFDELYAYIKSKGEIVGSQKIYQAYELIKKIEQVRHGHRDISFITRTDGIRDAVIKLLKNDHVYAKYVGSPK